LTFGPETIINNIRAGAIINTFMLNFFILVACFLLLVYLKVRSMLINQ